MSLINNILNINEKKQKKDLNINSSEHNAPNSYWQSNNLDDTLQDAIINRFKDIQENIEFGFFHIQESHDIINLDKLPREENYEKMNIELYSMILIDFAEKIDHITESFSNLKRESDEKHRKFQQSIKEFSKIMKTKGFNYKIGDSVADFINNNTENGKYNRISSREKEKIEDVVDSARKILDENSRLNKYHLQTFSPILTARNSVYEMAKNLDLMKDIQLDPSIKSIPSEEIDSILIDLIYDSINRTRVKKEIAKLREARRIDEIKHVKTEEKTKYISPNNIPQDKTSKTPIIIDRDFFHYFGINGQTLKKLSESKETYDSAKYFLSSLETIFNSAGLDEKQISVLVNKNPHLLFESKNKMNIQLNLIEKLYDLIDPVKVSGIQPSNNSEIYKSEDSLSKIITKEESKYKKINIININLITDEKDRETFENRMNCAKTGDERIQKYISRKAGKKTILYEKYSSEFGEGKYMKGKIGKDGRRVIYKVEPTETTINIRIISYFTNHNDHVNFFKPK